MKICLSDDWSTCPYAVRQGGEIKCILEHPEDDCDDYAYAMEEEE